MVRRGTGRVVAGAGRSAGDAVLGDDVQRGRDEPVAVRD
jgi:hypothetical protein